MDVTIKLITSDSDRESLRAIADRYREAREWLDEAADPRLISYSGIYQLYYGELRERFGLGAHQSQQVCQEVSIARGMARKNDGVVTFERDSFTLHSGGFSVFVGKTSKQNLSLSITGLSGREYYALKSGVRYYSVFVKKGTIAKKARVFLGDDGIWRVTVTLADRPAGKEPNHKEAIRTFNADCVSRKIGI